MFLAILHHILWFIIGDSWLNVKENSYSVQDKRMNEQFMNKMDTRTTAGEQTIFHRDTFA